MALIHNWPLDETTGSIVADVIGDSDALAVNHAEATIVPGQFGNARDGRDTSGGPLKIELWQGTVQEPSLSRYTLTFWMRTPATLLTNWPYAWEIGQYYVPSATEPYCICFFDKDFQEIHFELFDDAYNSSQAVIFAHQANFSDDQWHMVTLRCDGAKTDLIIDGAQVLTTPRHPLFNLKGAVGRTYFGGNDNNEYLGYLVDDIAIFDHSISDSEVDWLWNGGTGRAAASLTPVPIDAYISIPGPLQSPALLGVSDWTQTVKTTDQIYYAAEIYGWPDPVQLRLPISSWQATLQQGRASYLQCVVPAASHYIDAISEVMASEVKWLSIKRGVVLSDGSRREMEIARTRIQDMSHSRGPRLSTVTLSGYNLIAFGSHTVDSVDPSAFRTLPGVQTMSAQSGIRVRCGIDWLLRPGMVAIADGTPFVVSYINYYVSAGQEFCDVGER